MRIVIFQWLAAPARQSFPERGSGFCAPTPDTDTSFDGRRPGRAPVVRGGAFEGSVSRRHVDGHDALVAMATSPAQRPTAVPPGWLEDVPERPLQLWLQGGARLVLHLGVRSVPSTT